MVYMGRRAITSRHLFDSLTGLSGWPLFPMTGPLRWTYDIAEGSKPAKPPGPVFPRGAWQVASYSSVGAVRVVARRSAPHVDDCYGWPTQARITIERLSHVGKREQHASVSVSGLGILLSLSVHSFLICWLREYCSIGPSCIAGPARSCCNLLLLLCLRLKSAACLACACARACLLPLMRVRADYLGIP